MKQTFKNSKMEKKKKKIFLSSKLIKENNKNKQKKWLYKIVLKKGLEQIEIRYNCCIIKYNFKSLNFFLYLINILAYKLFCQIRLPFLKYF